jgi:probable H4MPT-linked C1 transfer pathway protein
LNVAALDIGGANLKAAHTAGPSAFAPFEVWREHGRLAAELESVLRNLPPYQLLAVTMTAELCDCFTTKREGVLQVLLAAEKASAAVSPEAALKVFRIDGRLVELEAARSEPLTCASANWLALAIFSATLLPRGRCVVADTGSTTTDIVPVRSGTLVPGGRTDAERLLIGELVYTGVRRTPILAVTDRLPYHDRSCPVAAELFATMLDAYLLTGDIAEDPRPAAAGSPTADGREAVRDRARDRLARMVCADRETFDQDDALSAARFLIAAQEKKVRQALLQVAERLGGPLEAAVVAGEGEFVLRRAIHRMWPRCTIIPFSEKVGREASRAACAHSLSRIAQEPARSPVRTGVPR